MGSAARHKRNFVSKHPFCIFCGGHKNASSIEHCPPRSMFQRREWPEGFEFPACDNCNQGTSDHDLLIAFLARMDPINERGNLDGRLEGIMYMVNKQFPNLYNQMRLTASEARRKNKELGIKPFEGLTHQEMGLINIPNALHESVCILASKLAKALYYKETSNIFPKEGGLMMNWFTNVELVKNGNYPMFDLLNHIGGNAPLLFRAKNLLNDQFSYKLTLSPNNEIIVLQALFGNSFGFVVFGCTKIGYLENANSALKLKFNRESPFSFLS